MRLVRFVDGGTARAGLVDPHGRIRSLAPIVEDWSVRHLEDDWLRTLAALDMELLPVVDGTPELLPPIADIRQILAIGLNYRDHAAEAGLDLPIAPMLFMKSIGSLAGSRAAIPYATHASALDWEVELAILLRRPGRHIPVDRALEHVGGYLLAMDVSERDWQLKEGGQFGKGKSYDAFSPVGPWLTTPDEVPDPQRLTLRLEVNGEVRQLASTAQMVFGVADIIAHLSRFQTLLAGDLIMTGTPAGVGLGARPPVFLQRGDRITCEIDGLGRQDHLVVEEQAQRRVSAPRSQEDRT